MQPKLKNQSSDLSLDGLEGLLDSAKPMQYFRQRSTANSGDERSQDWTLEETARALGLSRGAVIRRLEDGILAGYRVRRSYGWVWRVKPSWLSSSARKEEDDSIEVEQAQPPTNAASDVATMEKTGSESAEYAVKPDSREFVEVFDACEESAGLPALPPVSFRELIELKTKLEMTEFQFQDAYQKLQSANYKIGYLEARLEASLEQLKMISDPREKQPWWRRWLHIYHT